jgi:hypothetical protein
VHAGAVGGARARSAPELGAGAAYEARGDGRTGVTAYAAWLLRGGG